MLDTTFLKFKVFDNNIALKVTVTGTFEDNE